MNGILEQPSLLRRCTLIVYWTLMFVGTHWPDIETWAPARWKIPHGDKLLHVFMYGGWMTIWWWVLAGRKAERIGRTTIAWLLVGGVTYAAFDEITQAVVDRDPSLLDWACDVLGLTVAMLILRRISDRRPSQSHSLR